MRNKFYSESFTHFGYQSDFTIYLFVSFYLSVYIIRITTTVLTATNTPPPPHVTITTKTSTTVTITTTDIIIITV